MHTIVRADKHLSRRRKMLIQSFLACNFRDPEVEYLYFSTAGSIANKDVIWFDISMNNAVTMA